MGLKISASLLLWLPWIILLLERLLGIGHISTPPKPNMQNKNSNGLHQALKQSKSNSLQRRLPLYSLTGTTYDCDEGLMVVQNLLLFGDQQQRRADRMIPPIFHQTSISRCLTPAFYNLTTRWRHTLPEEWSYLFHDETSMGRLLNKDRKEFGLLKHILQCTSKGTVEADLWRYLVLYEYGGIYADIDAAPSLTDGGFNVSLLAGQQALFVVDKYNMMSEFFLAATPKHPLLFYTIHHALQRLLTEKDTGTTYPGRITGPHALLAGFKAFQSEVGLEVGTAAERPAKAGVYRGKHNWTVTIIGTELNEIEFVTRQAITNSQKLADYKTMGIKYYLDDMEPTNQSCLNAVYERRIK